MPSNIIAAAPTEVMPYGLLKAFTHEYRWEILKNDLPDGSAVRAPQVLVPRSFFQITRAMTAIQWATLRVFYQDHKYGAPFWFYDLKESNGAFDPTGSASAGRYTVVFDSSWSENLAIGRSQSSFALREVA